MASVQAASPKSNGPPAATPRGGLSAKLLEITGRAKAFTGAAGAAVALTVGDQFVTCAACGTYPKQGAPLRLEQNFIQLCPRTNKVLRCNDIDADPRIDAAFYRALK